MVGLEILHEHRSLVRLTTIVSVLAASYYLAPRSSVVHLTVVIAAFFALALLRWPPLGVLALVASSQVVPFAIGTGTETSLNAPLLLVPVLFGLLVLSLASRHNPTVRWDRPVWPLLALDLAALIAMIAGLQPWIPFANTASVSAQAGGLAIFLLSTAAFVVAGYQMPDERWLRWLTWLFVCLGAVYIAGRILPTVSLGRFFQRGSDGSLFWTWLAVMAFSQGAFNRDAKLVWRLGLLAVAAGTLYVGLFPGRDWISGWLPPVIGVVVSLWLGAPRLGLIATLACGVGLFLDPSSVASLTMGGDNQYSLDTRVAAWQTLGQIVSVSPVIGLGPANYHFYTPLFSILGYHVAFNSHNNYVDVLAQTGIIGLGCLLWFVVEVARLGWRLRRRAATGFGQAYVRGALGGLAGTVVSGMLGDWLLPFVYNIGLQGFRASVLGWVFLGGLVALGRFAERHRSREGEQRGD